MRKILSVLLILSMLLGLSGCALFATSSKSDASDPKGETTAPPTALVPAESIVDTTPTEGEIIISEVELEDPEASMIVPEAETEKPTEMMIQSDTPIVDIISEQTELLSYFVPQILCSTPDVIAINEEIDKNYGDIAREAIDASVDGYYTGCYEVNYSYHWYDDVLVLIVWKDFDGGCRYHAVYCVDRITGKRLSNREILELCCVSETVFVEQAKYSAAILFRDRFESVPSDSDFYQFGYDLSTGDEEINMDMRMYPSEDGALMLISNIASLAGAEAYEMIYPFMAE